MKKGKRGRVNGIYRGFLILSAVLLISPLMASADEGTGENGGGVGGFFSNIGKGISDLFSKVPGRDIFSELSPEDVGYKPRVKPHFYFNQGFTSNARLGENQADAAWQARVAPGIQVAIPSGKLYTEVDYTYGFSTTQGRKTNANINTHELNALARYDLSADTVVGIGNNIQLSEVPGEPGKPFFLETGSGQISHRIGPKLTAHLTDIFRRFEDKTEIEEIAESDFWDNGVSLKMDYDVASDLILGPSFGWNVRQFDSNDLKSYWQIQPLINASYEIGPKTTMTGNFGWAYRSFEEELRSIGHESELVYGAGVHHKLGRKLIWSVKYAKTLTDTFETDFVFRDVPEAVILDNYSRNFRVIKVHRLGSSVTYHLNERNSFGVFGDFQILNASAEDNVVFESDGDEQAMQVGANYVYRINRYISFDVGYTFGRRFTSENTPARAHYTFHKATAGVNVSI